jgi:phosphoserine phosphatase RsbU/P
MSVPTANSAWLIPLPGGPPLKPLNLTPVQSKDRGILIGRGETCDLRLEDPKVSRPHAQFIEDRGGWRIADKGSRWGTFVNGQKIQPGNWVPVAEGDHIQIKPWTFLFSMRGISHQTMRTIDDAGTINIRALSRSVAEPLKEELLKVLLDGSAVIQAVKDEKSLNESLVEIAGRGTGLPNAVVLRVLDSNGGIEILAQRSDVINSHRTPGFSRSLLAAAAQGDVVELSSDSEINVSHSLIEANVQAAICAPLVLGSTVAAYLYLDARGAPAGGLRTLRPNAAGFCQALARMGGLALANLKRIETEMRIIRMEADLEAASIAQHMILPRGSVTSGNVICFGKSRSSKHLGGDFFDFIPLPDGRLVVTLGDVSGHGAEASVLMTAAQGFLRAAFRYHDDVARAVTDLNDFIQSRCPPGKFITLWVGLFDGLRKELHYVDAGHGLALLLSSGGKFKTLDANDGQMLNVDACFKYRATIEPLLPGESLLIISDGIKEQPKSGSGMEDDRVEFGMDRVKAVAAAESSEMIVKRLFEDLFAFAGTQDLADDTTAVLVQWS